MVSNIQHGQARRVWPLSMAGTVAVGSFVGGALGVVLIVVLENLGVF